METFSDLLVEFSVDVTEMTDDPRGIVTLNGSRVQELIEDYADEKPQFPILRVEAGESNNGNNWPEAILRDVAEQINRDEKPGYWGHIPPDQRGFSFPDPETLWLGATTRSEGGKEVLYVKGYNIPGSRARRHKSLARVTSWAGKASGRVVNRVRMIDKFALESIDWARPGAQGMNARVVAFATEMEGGENEVDVNTLTPDELRRQNPNLVVLIEREAVSEMEDELQQAKARATEADKADETFKKLRNILGVAEDVDIVQAVADVQGAVTNLNKQTLMEKVGEIVSGKLKSDKAKSTVLALFDRPALVTEMEGLNDEALKTKVESYFDTDEAIKTVVTEMDNAPAPLTHRSSGGTKGDSQIGRSGMVRETRVRL